MNHMVACLEIAERPSERLDIRLQRVVGACSGMKPSTSA
jgi:hypothetical protein